MSKTRSSKEPATTGAYAICTSDLESTHRRSDVDISKSNVIALSRSARTVE
jgi:hypothetical protein